MFFAEATSEFVKATEAAAAKWWDATLRAPKTLETMGMALGGLSGAKERMDRTMEQTWSAWRLPTALDVERLHERMGELEEQIAELQLALEGANERLGAAGEKPAAKSSKKSS
tara:strand:- start:82 stop:420 length:339 start_codon:yes stop_codon:yes gene_type:complete